MQPLSNKIIVITILAEPKYVDELYLGLTGYYKMFVPLFVNVTKPLNKLLRKDIKFQWSIQCQLAFAHLKNVLCKKPILQYPDIKSHTPCPQIHATMPIVAFSLWKLMV